MMAIEVECEHCQAKMTVQPHKAGQTIHCPRCKHELLVPKPAKGEIADIADIASSGKSKTFFPAAKSGGFLRVRLTNFDFGCDLLRTIATLLIVCSLIGLWMSLNDRSSTYSESGPYGGVLEHRFQKDNAVGATANAVEWIAEHTASPPIGPAMWLGIALWGLASLRRTRLSIERLAERLAPAAARIGEQSRKGN